MNTTHRAPRPRVTLPPLPTEIWLSILERACSAGNWNPFELHSAVDFSLSSVRQRKKILRESLVTKRAVVRVCKQWNAWTLPYLYENLYLGKFRYLHSLRDALSRPHGSEGVSLVGHTSGKWTKRLDIALRGRLSAREDSKEYTDLISEIVQCLPNLSIVNFATNSLSSDRSPLFPSSILESLANTCGQTLQAVIWERHIFPPIVHAWRPFLEKAVNIKILHCPTHPMAARGIQAPPALSSLQFLRPRKNTLLAANVPSLRHLILDIDYDTEHRWQLFLQVHGEKLEVVQLEVFDHYLIASITSFLSASCPNLVRLDISAPSWDLLRCLGRDSAVPPSVRILGIQNTSIQASSEEYRRLFDWLKDMKLTSSLNCIQLIDSGNVKNITHHHHRILMKGIEMLGKRGLELRDYEGSLMG